MNPSEKNHLLKETLGGDELDDFRRSSLERSLAVMGRGRRQRRIMRAGMVTGLPLMLAVAAIYFHSQSAPKTVVQQVDNPKKEPVVAVAQVQPAAVKLISDEELLAMFPDRATALVGHAGRQELVFLDVAKTDEIPDGK